MNGKPQIRIEPQLKTLADKLYSKYLEVSRKEALLKQAKEALHRWIGKQDYVIKWDSKKGIIRVSKLLWTWYSSGPVAEVVGVSINKIAEVMEWVLGARVLNITIVATNEEYDLGQEPEEIAEKAKALGIKLLGYFKYNDEGLYADVIELEDLGDVKVYLEVDNTQEENEGE